MRGADTEEIKNFFSGFRGTHNPLTQLIIDNRGAIGSYDFNSIVLQCSNFL